MGDLAAKKCVPCTGGTPPLAGEALASLYAELGSDWQLIDDHHLMRVFRFPNFRDALEFTNRVGALAESVNHHPDIELAWGKVKLSIWTHKIGGLSESDFIWAAKATLLFDPPNLDEAGVARSSSCRGRHQLPRNTISLISAGAPSRIGGPQNPVPRLT